MSSRLLKKKKEVNKTTKRSKIDDYEYWYDYNPEHNGALRAIDYKNKIIYGSDPDLPIWKVKFEFINENQIKIDFSTKKTHIHDIILYATFTNNNGMLRFTKKEKDKLPDDNFIVPGWCKIGCNPNILLKYLNK